MFLMYINATIKENSKSCYDTHEYSFETRQAERSNVQLDNIATSTDKALINREEKLNLILKRNLSFVLTFISPIYVNLNLTLFSINFYLSTFNFPGYSNPLAFSTTLLIALRH